MQVEGILDPTAKRKCLVWTGRVTDRGNIDRPRYLLEGTEPEHNCCDPKDSELCPGRLKPDESLVEDRSGSDVQIDRQIWV